jgi:hypothetical protein
MKPTMRECSGSFKLILLLAFGACLLMSGCGSSETVWSAESRSPDGKVIAAARTAVRNRGLSIISGADTNVYLKWAKGSRGDTSILELADATDDPVDTRVEMNWLTPTHLELTFKGNQSIVFQAIQWAGIDISVRDLSEAAIKSENATRSLAPTPPPFAYRKTVPRSSH